MQTLSTFDLEQIKTIIAKNSALPGSMLPILHEIQDTVGFVPAAAVPLIADALNISRAEVHGVVTYYHHFKQHPGAKHVLKLCSAEACQAVGSAALAEHARQTLGCDFHQSTSDGLFALEPVYCLGLCASGPSVMVNDAEVHGRMSAQQFDGLVQELRGAK